MLIRASSCKKKKKKLFGLIPISKKKRLVFLPCFSPKVGRVHLWLLTILQIIVCLNYTFHPWDISQVSFVPKL